MPDGTSAVTPRPASRIPFAWLSLTHRKSRLAASVSGVAFATVLMFVELGFRNGLTDSQVHVARMFNADLVIVHQHKDAVAPAISFPKERLAEARAVRGVAAVYPVYLDEYHAAWKNRTDGREYPILVYGIVPEDPVFLLPDVTRLAPLLKVPDTVLLDAKSRDFYGRIEPGVVGELARRATRVAGTFSLGPDFRIDGSAIVSDRTFLRVFAKRQGAAGAEERVEFGLVKIRAGASAAEVQALLRQALPADVKVLTKNEFIRSIEDFWNGSKPVGYVFGLGLLVGFAIGVAICYQILYTDIVDQLPQFATLKAIGYTNRSLVRIVLEKAFYLAVMGFAPGLLIALATYAVLQWYAGIRMELTVPRALLVMILTLAMCLTSAAIAIRKVAGSDPAEVF
jgi:putative ABC transport system permease protein